jgi:hypothetical protein
MEMRVAAPVAMTARAAETNPGPLPAEQQWRAESDPADVRGMLQCGIGKVRAALGRQMRQIGRNVRRLQPARLANGKFGRRGGTAQQQRRGADQGAGAPLASTHRLSSSASAHPNVHTESSFASIRLAPAMSPRSTSSSP